MIWAPVAATSCGRRPLTVPWVPTGMKAGVSNAPCRVMTRPRRARPTVLERTNCNGASGMKSQRSWYSLYQTMARAIAQVERLEQRICLSAGALDTGFDGGQVIIRTTGDYPDLTGAVVSADLKLD